MRSKIYLDANFIIALFVRNHPFHHKAAELHDSLSTGDYVVSLLTIDEVLHSLGRYQISKAKVANLVEEFILQNQVSTIHGQGNQSAEYVRLWAQLGLAPRDCLHVYLLETNKIDSLLSFDRELSTLATKRGIRVYSSTPNGRGYSEKD